MRRIHKLFAVGASSVLLGLTLTPAALAAGSARLSSGRAGSAATLPATSIKGSPAKFSPDSLKAKAKEPSGGTCSSATASFVILNKESKTEKVTFFVGSKNEGSVSIAKKKGEYICVGQGFTGTLKGKLSDKKSLTVKF